MLVVCSVIGVAMLADQSRPARQCCLYIFNGQYRHVPPPGSKFDPADLNASLLVPAELRKTSTPMDVASTIVFARQLSRSGLADTGVRKSQGYSFFLFNIHWRRQACPFLRFC